MVHSDRDAYVDGVVMIGALPNPQRVNDRPQVGAIGPLVVAWELFDRIPMGRTRLVFSRQAKGSSGTTPLSLKYSALTERVASARICGLFSQNSGHNPV